MIEMPIGPLQIDDRDNPWRSMDRAPKNATWVEVKVSLGIPEKHNGFSPCFFPSKVYIAHWAEGGGEEQPPFRGWFEAVVRSDGTTSWFNGIPEPFAWRPLSQPPIEKVYV